MGNGDLPTDRENREIVTYYRPKWVHLKMRTSQVGYRRGRLPDERLLEKGVIF